jgi:lysozyme family protein
MSVEDVQKVNKLAQDLLDQNMASSREDAVKQAQQILNKDIVDKQEIKEDGTVAAKDDLDYYKNIITRTKEYTLQQLNVFKKEIETLTSEVTKLKGEIESLKTTETQQCPKNIEKPKQKKLKTQKKEETNQRTGKFSPSDVAVDKIFYYGNK